MTAKVCSEIVTSARRNMRAHALAWREATSWRDNVEAVMKLRRAILWRDTANRIQSLSPDRQPAGGLLAAA